MELQGRVDELRRSGFGLAAISYDSPEILAEFARRRGITFPLLSDRGSQTIRAFGLLNTTLPESSPTFGIPFPGTLVLDSRGTVRARTFEQAYQNRETAANTLLALGAGPARHKAGQATAHVKIASAVTDDTVAAGTVFSVVVDVKPRPRMHVYAAGAKGYRAVSLVIEPQRGLQVRGIRLPEPQQYHFKPLDEVVPVYQRPFRLVQELSVDASREAQEALKGIDRLVVRGRLDYQACDDKACFAPESVPLSWTVNLKALDRERSGAR